MPATIKTQSTEAAISKRTHAFVRFAMAYGRGCPTITRSSFLTRRATFPRQPTAPLREVRVTLGILHSDLERFLLTAHAMKVYCPVPAAMSFSPRTRHLLSPTRTPDCSLRPMPAPGKSHGGLDRLALRHRLSGRQISDRNFSSRLNETGKGVFNCCAHSDTRNSSSIQRISSTFGSRNPRERSAASRA